VDNPYPSPNGVCILGLCTGTLAAAAISCCRTVSELLPVAIETVLVAFRTGICTLDVRNRIEPSTESCLSWSIAVGGSSAAQVAAALKEFRRDNVRIYKSFHLFTKSPRLTCF
jgi:hypothetical protein